MLLLVNNDNNVIKVNNAVCNQPSHNINPIASMYVCNNNVSDFAVRVKYLTTELSVFVETTTSNSF